jgi:hypothetical protein
MVRLVVAAPPACFANAFTGSTYRTTFTSFTWPG